MGAAELCVELESRGLETTGKRQVLIDRLRKARSEEVELSTLKRKLSDVGADVNGTKAELEQRLKLAAVQPTDPALSGVPTMLQFIYTLLTASEFQKFLNPGMLQPDRARRWLRQKELMGFIPDELCKNCVNLANRGSKSYPHERDVHGKCMMTVELELEIVREMIREQRIRPPSLGAHAGLPASLLPPDFNPAAGGQIAVAGLSDGRDFSWESAMICRPGFLSKDVGGGESWFQAATYKDRVHTMVVFFQARKFLLERGLSSRQKELLTADLAMFKRVNAASRLETPTTSWAYSWYVWALQQRAGCSVVQRFAEFILNASLVRNSLSLYVRTSMRDKELCWLRLEFQSDGGCMVANFVDLDTLFVKARGEIFGTFVNPMRVRNRDPMAGYLALIKDCITIAERAMLMASSFLERFDVSELMERMRAVPGYGGTGFRAKEVVSDLVDNLVPAGFVADGSVAHEQIKKDWHRVTVIGVGPCRTVNYLFGYNFFLYEALDSSRNLD